MMRRKRSVPETIAGCRMGLTLPVALLFLAAMAIIALKLVDRSRIDIAIAQAPRR